MPSLLSVPPPLLLVLLAAALLVSVQGGSELMSRCFAPDQVALTFEGGPDAAKTPLILDALKRFNATATFFVRAVSLNGWPAIQTAKRIVSEGHAIGLLLEPTMEQRQDISIDVLASSIANHIDIIDKTIGRRLKFVRANYANTTSKFGDYLNSNGYICTVPGIDVKDEGGVVAGSLGPLRAIINELPLKGSPIIRLHDTAALTANMAKDIVEYLQVTAGKKLVDIVNCTGMAFAYDQSKDGISDFKEGRLDVGDKPLDIDGHLFDPPKPRRVDEPADRRQSSSGSVERARSSRYGMVLVALLVVAVI
jgi:peptidoglycan/xylan/chitin deacetylase (PgdA/CDA1 family)